VFAGRGDAGGRKVPPSGRARACYTEIVPAAPTLPVDPREHPIVLFDGVCHLCAGVVRFAIARDSEARFRFAPLQSPLGRGLLARHGYDPDGIDAVVLVDGDGAHDRSTAALRLLAGLRTPWRLLARPLLALPRGLRDAVYGWIARHRYRWFGRSEECQVPTPEVRARFL
jgi:predicted DCC family thiol-disulfide oxidoreductase YuxK